jgi:cyclophilin family peptidyl-prolyl cis-trans isomerase/HEAT repeat protein
MKIILHSLAVSITLLVVLSANAQGQTARRQSADGIPTPTLLTIIRHEDERRWDDQLLALLTDTNPKVRARAALAAGRIGDERAVPPLAEMVFTGTDVAPKEMAVFALGEIEAAGGAYALITVLKDPQNPARARAIEALGKITAAMMSAAGANAAEKGTKNEKVDACKAAIVDALRFELDRQPTRDRLTVLLGLTAILRTRPDDAGPLVTKFLNDPDPAIVATALNTMARLRLKDANQRVRDLLTNNDPMVRANAVRVIGAAEDKEAFEAVLDRALHDGDLRVRVSAIRALASLKDVRAADVLIKRGNSLADSERKNSNAQNELLEIASTLGRLLPNSMNADAIDFLRALRVRTNGEAVEVETALGRIAPGIYLTNPNERNVPGPAVGSSWRQIARRAQGLAAIKEVTAGSGDNSAGAEVLKSAQKELATMLDRQSTPVLAVPDVLQAYNSYKPPDITDYAKKFLQARDVVVRATAAELIGEQPPSESSTRALIDALPSALHDRDSNDAALAILNALGKQKSSAANEAIKTAFDSTDHLVRRRAVALLKTSGAGDFSSRIGTAQTRNTPVDYRRAMARIGKSVTATIFTTRGSFIIEFLPEDAPLTVDNFVQLAKRGYFNGQTVPRVVPNFVIQTGDPRGDQNGGPGYQIRCEINEVSYERAAVGMALSGKDTGGSQWFVTHSPQPHLDGGYTVFGHVTRGMEVVDNIVRGDAIRRVVVSEK